MGVADGGHRAGDRRQVDRLHAGGVGGGPAQHVLRVGHRVVVAQNRGQHLRLVAQVEPAAAQVACGGQRRVEHVLRVGLAVVVAVRGVPRPGSRQELHRTQRSGVDGAAGLVGLHDDLVARQRAVQRRAIDRADGGARGVGRAAVGVHRLDPADTGQQVPAHAAVGRAGGHDLLGVAVGGQGDGGDAHRAPRVDDHRGRGSRDQWRGEVKVARGLVEGHHHGAVGTASGRRDRRQWRDVGVTHRGTLLAGAGRDGANQHDRRDHRNAKGRGA